MDLFTHVLVAYLITFGIVGFHTQYLAAGALAGGLPDADALLFPLARRFPILRHHGITHSIFGVTVLALAGALIAPFLAAGSPWIYFVVMEIGGLSHVAEDGFTNFSVPPLLPFSQRQVHLDADRAINFATLVFSVASFYVLLGVERNHVAFPIYLATLYALTAFFAAYFALRLAARIHLERRRGSLAPNAAIVPTGNPLRWVILSEEVGGGRVRTTWERYVLGRGVVDGPHSVEAPIDAPPHAGPPTSAFEALSWSYGLARRASRMIESTYHFGEAFRAATGEWEAVWYSLEFTAFGRSAAVRVRFPPGGAPPEVKSTFYRPRERIL